MSDEETGLEEVKEPTTDISVLDQVRIDAYKEKGMPGLYALEESTIARLMELYLMGKPYSQMASLTRLEKGMVMFLSQKYNWFLARKEYHQELEATIRQRVIESKIVSQDFLLQMTQLWQKKIGKKINRYFATDDEQHANDIDLKEVDKYLKTLEILHRSTDGSGRVQGPAVGLNLGDGVTVTKTGANSVEITPKQKAIGDILAQYADSRREEETKKNADIKSRDSNKKEKK